MARSLAKAAVVFIALCAASASAQDVPDLTGMSLDDLLETEVVYAASRRNQSLREAPSAVSVVTAAEIREHGYRTIADVLRSLPSFYVTEDRRYSYVGVRGFNRPGDYGARVLLLLDGLRTNDNLYEQAYIGQEFLLDIDLVDRIEVVRGPSAAIYGNSAFFAVVNVVTRHGRDFEGGELSAAAGSFGRRSARASHGRRLDNGLEFVVSASLADSEGQRLYFAEYDTPETANGVADRVDGERVERARVALTRGDFSLEATHVSREKGVPTGAYGTRFGDARTRHTDAKDLVSLSWARTLADRSSLSARVHYGLSDYHGTYVFENPVLNVNDDSARGQWYAIDSSVVRPLGARHLVTAGVEFQDNFSQRLLNFNVEPRIVYLDSRNRSRRLGVFGQDEITLSPRLTLHLGLREDWYESFGYQTSPRAALVFGDGKRTTLKLLHGRAFRAPNEFELHFAGPAYKTNPALGPETIHGTELVLERTFRGGLQLDASGYVNHVDNLISLQEDPADGLLRYENTDEGDSVGAEIGLSLKRPRGPSARVSYAWQRSRLNASGELLTNSPRHMAKAQVTWPLWDRRLTAGLDGWYLGDRRTLAGARTGSSTIANLTLSARRLRGRYGLSASVYNLFDERYADPGPPEIAQDLLFQDGRNVRLELSLRF
jgi:outer membrane receptor protein involved in Fe transport